MKKVLLSSIFFLIVFLVFSQKNYEIFEHPVTKAGRTELIYKEVPRGNFEPKSLAYDSLNMNWTGSWSLGQSFYISASSTGDTVFIGSGAGVIIMDASDPYNPVVLSEVHARALVDAIHYNATEQRLYLAAYFAGLEIWDVSDIQNPQKLSSIGTSGLPRGGVFTRKASPSEETHAYLTTVADGIDVFSIDDNGIPTFVGNQWYTSQLVWTSYGYEDHIFIAAGSGGTLAVDLTQLPPNMNSDFTVYGNSTSVAVQENQLFVVNYSSGLKIHDISSIPATLIGELTLEGYPYRIALTDNLAYIANSTTNNGGGINIIDISDPTIPTASSLVNSPQTYISGNENTIYATGGAEGCIMIDATDPENPVIASETKLPISCNDIAVKGNYAYTGSNGFRVFDVTDKSKPVQVGYSDTDGSLVKLYGNYAIFCPKSMGSGNKVNIMDVSDPNNPVKVGQYNAPVMTYDLATKGQFAYVACWWDGIRVVDFSDPSSPSLTSHKMGWVNGGIPGEEWMYCQALDTEGDYLYAIDYGPFPDEDTRGLYVFDISDPSNPELIKRAALEEGSYYDIDVYGDYACLADNMGGLAVFSVMDPTNPTQLSYLQLGDAAWAVDMFMNYAFVANYINEGVQVIDISDPFVPSVAGYYKRTGCFALNVTHYEGFVYVADGPAGMQIYNFDLLTGTEEKTSVSNGFEIFPNPASEQVKISGKITANGSGTITIYSYNGQEIKTANFEIVNNTLNINLNVNDLPKGIYILKLKSGNQLENRKLVIQ